MKHWGIHEVETPWWEDKEMGDEDLVPIVVQRQWAEWLLERFPVDEGEDSENGALVRCWDFVTSVDEEEVMNSLDNAMENHKKALGRTP